MTRHHLTALLLCVPMAATAADDFKISQLETDVRDLQRQVQAQSQQINELRSQLARPVGQPRTPSASPAAATSSGTWLDASKWQRVHSGMSELEVISVLGPPTSMRNRDSERVLFYAMEIGASGFLSGSVTLRDRLVLEVQLPALR